MSKFNFLYSDPESAFEIVGNKIKISNKILNNLTIQMVDGFTKFSGF